MKHIFKKLHFGGFHATPHGVSPSSPSPSSAAAKPASCGSDHRRHGGGELAVASSSPSSPGDGGAGPAAEVADYFTSEEEFQVQLALAISASNSEFREDPDDDQIRAATLLSLGKQRTGAAAEEDGTAETLSRRYWDYNVLDYDVKVTDGFYDIFGLSLDPLSRGNVPSLADLETNIGDLGFEVIIVNRAIDPALVELEQIAHCIALDCPSSEVDLLVQRISDLVVEHMGGPVKDAGDILARWMERSSELRTSLQTSLLAIGCINVGLSCHRALLFKVLADHVGIPCKVVKGSHYTGVDDVALNMIKLDHREFLVDLMAAPGTLIPADVLSAKDASLNFSNPRTKDQASWTTNGSSSALPWIEAYRGDNSGVGKSSPENSGIIGRTSRTEKAVVVSSFASVGSEELPSSSGSSSNGRMLNFVSPGDPHQDVPSTSTCSQKGSSDSSFICGGEKEKLTGSSHLQDVVDSRNLFAELNPFQLTGVGKFSSQFNVPTETKKNGLQRCRENIMSCPGRAPLPLVWKNRSACNEGSNKKQCDCMAGPFPRKNVELKDIDASASSSSLASSEKIYAETPKPNVPGISVPYSAKKCSDDRSVLSGGCSSAGDSVQEESSMNLLSRDDGKTDEHVKILSLQKQCQRKDCDKCTIQYTLLCGPDEGKNADREARRNCTHDRLVDLRLLKDPGSTGIPEQTGMQKLDPMLDDVAECEVPWEDLVIGERIGLGSYGEVYRADWNGTEVAVKKFLDQDFSGDALDEFRREVRIMRRLRHPNVVLFMGAVTRPPNLSIIIEFLPRGSLYRILHRSNCKIDEKRRIKMALDVAKGMNCLHTSTPIIVHRDLKSPNLLVDKNWNVKVCDFGLSRLKHNTFLSSKSTAGTPEWMAPEVLRNEPSNEKCDVYSFGVILWELTTLRMPWSGMNPMQVVGAVGFQNRLLDVPKEVDPVVARIIWECWQTDPSLRPSFAKLTSALKPLQQLVVSSHQGSHSPPIAQEISVNSTP